MLGEGLLGGGEHSEEKYGQELNDEEDFTLRMSPENDDAISLSSDDLGIDPYLEEDDAKADDDPEDETPLALTLTATATATIVIDYEADAFANGTATIDVEADHVANGTAATQVTNVDPAGADAPLFADAGDAVDENADDEDAFSLRWTQTIASQSNESPQAAPAAVQAQAPSFPLSAPVIPVPSSTPVAATGLLDSVSGSSSFSLTYSPTVPASSLVTPLAHALTPLVPLPRPSVPTTIDLTSQSQVRAHTFFDFVLPAHLLAKV
jgi:hypothetical protein